MSDQISILPVSAQATKTIVENYDYGDMVTLTEMYRMLEVEYSDNATREEDKEIEWKRCSRIQDVKDRLLEEYSIMIKNVRGEGYVLVMPKEQTDVSLDDMDNKLKKHMRIATKRLKHVRFDMLSEKKQQQNVSARQRAAGIKSMLRRERKLFAVGLKKIESDD
jgi:hypothetical protein